MRAFFDTNILVYAFDDTQPVKQELASALMRQLWDRPDPICISTQVAIEFYNAVRRQKIVDRNLAAYESALSGMHCMPTSMQTVQEAWSLFRAHKLSWFDALIVQSALDAKCSHLFTEDMQNGRKFGGLEVVNPFT